MRRCWLPLLLPLLAGGCDDAAPEASGSGASAGDQGVVVEWLDSEQRAESSSFHRLAGQLTAPRADGDQLRRIARDALVDRARELGFSRLDNLQIESSCDDDAPEATACQARIVAVASR